MNRGQYTIIQCLNEKLGRLLLDKARIGAIEFVLKGKVKLFLFSFDHYIMSGTA